MSRKNKISLLDLVKHPLITDKTTKLIEENQYSFAVDRKADKANIKQAIEYIFDVDVKHVNTCNSPVKARKVGRFIGLKPKYKKAIITLKEGSSITIFPET